MIFSTSCQNCQDNIDLLPVCQQQARKHTLNTQTKYLMTQQSIIQTLTNTNNYSNASYEDTAWPQLFSLITTAFCVLLHNQHHISSVSAHQAQPCINVLYYLNIIISVHDAQPYKCIVLLFSHPTYTERFATTKGKQKHTSWSFKV